MSEMVLSKYEEISAYFNKAKLFSSIPQIYQDRIVEFFFLERQQIVDPVAVKQFFQESDEIHNFLSLDEIDSFAKERTIKGILAHKVGWENLGDLDKWNRQVSERIPENGDVILFTHFEELSLEEATIEWYMVSCIKDVA